ncbi:MAG: N-6 DNA methylase [Rikenellaceae bacterium]|nr:N-6 DNA methylase [Rikenellaceae bacterium]
MYQVIPQPIPQEQRAVVNEKILFCIDTDNNKIPPEGIFNCYTGLGGTHDLKQEDFANYNEYAEAKKEFELGQFFTPPEICQKIVELVNPDPNEMVLEMCCGMGNFFNYLPNHFNAFGFDIDPNAIKVAKYLYPDANFEVNDLYQYKGNQSYDIVIGNPPFNLKIGGKLSQHLYCEKAHELLNPMGFLIFIAPCSYLGNDFWDKRRANTMNNLYSFIGQSKLPKNAFKNVGVSNFSTKVMVFMRSSRQIESKPYSADEFVTFDELTRLITEARNLKASQRLKLIRESTEEARAEYELFEYKTKKYLYELKNHKHLRKHYNKGVALITKYRNQKPPDNCTREDYKEWERTKLTPERILASLRKYIRQQYEVPRKEISVVKNNYCIRLKGYAPRMLNKLESRRISINDLVLGLEEIPVPAVPTPKHRQQVRSLQKLIRRKKREYEDQSRIIMEMDRVPWIDDYLKKQTFLNKEYEVCHFTELQQHDLGLAFQKRFILLNWQQGSGKTAAAYHYGKYLLKYRKVKNAIIMAPAIATNLTWLSFLETNREEFYFVNRISDFHNIPEGVFIVLPSSMLGKIKRQLRTLLKMRSNNVAFIFDESDEITNPTSQRTINTLAVFRRCSHKLLATGTTTRNNINELYSQLELLYNNSFNFICWCDTVYKENEDKEIEEKTNDYYGSPFPAYRGHVLFKHCFCPSKATVFGIEKVNQDIYNKDVLADIIAKTIITRKFREFAGEKYSIDTITVKPAKGEYEVYRVIAEEFYRICELYFNNTGDTRKEAGLRMMRQIKLLIRACSVPNHIDGYFGDKYPSKTKKVGDLIKKLNEKIAVGCTTLQSMDMYIEYLEGRFPDRPIFLIRGDISFKKRQKIIASFEATVNGILISTQQSLKNSVNIPTCNHVVIEALQWNLPVMEQYYFRFIRLDSKHHTTVHFITYEDSIEQNLMALILSKERLNEFVASLEVKEQSEVYDEFNVSLSIIDTLMRKQYDSEGKVHLTWGRQKIIS